MAAVAADEVAVPLLDSESHWSTLMMRGITTLTWYSGLDCQAAGDALRPRAAELLRKNPWLAGRLARDRRTAKVVLLHPKVIDDADVNAFLRVHGVRDPSVLAKTGGRGGDAEWISRSSPYETTCAFLARSGLQLPEASKRIGTSELVARLSVVADVSGQGFALVFSVCNAVADGHTYYTLLSMLSAGASVSPMVATRQPELEPRMVEAQGEAEHRWGFGRALMCHLCCAATCWCVHTHSARSRRVCLPRVPAAVCPLAAALLLLPAVCVLPAV